MGEVEARTDVKPPATTLFLPSDNKNSFKFARPFTAVGWNARSLYAYDRTETIDYVRELVKNHDIGAFFETRETDGRKTFLENVLPTGWTVKSSGWSQYKGGVTIIVKNTFLENFSSVEWKVLEKGWLGRLELSGIKGTLHVYAIYLDPGCWKRRNRQMQKIIGAYNTNAHNLLLGDCTFTLCSNDRISKSCEPHGDNTLKKSAEAWRQACEKYI